MSGSEKPSVVIAHTPEAQARIEESAELADQKLIAFRNTHGGREPTVDEYHDIMQEVAKERKGSYKPHISHLH